MKSVSNYYLQNMVLSMMYASDRPIFTGCLSSTIFSIKIGTDLYANVMSPLSYNVTLNVNDPSSWWSCSETFSQTTVNAVPVERKPRQQQWWENSHADKIRVVYRYHYPSTARWKRSRCSCQSSPSMVQCIASPPAKSGRIRLCTRNPQWLLSHFAPDARRMGNRMKGAASEMRVKWLMKQNESKWKIDIATYNCSAMGLR